MLLNGRLELHGADAEGLARKALDDALRGRSIRLRPHEHEDAVAFLVAECWRLSLDYDPARTPSFSTYAYRRLRLLVWEWHGASTRGRNGSSETDESTSDPVLISSVSTPTMRGEVDWTRLSERGRAILRTIAIPISAGCSPGEVARSLGTTSSWVSKRLNELRNELERSLRC